eukprot:scaffold117706_cov16-Tisochrysis_lutea.AAC.1
MPTIRAMQQRKLRACGQWSPQKRKTTEDGCLLYDCSMNNHSCGLCYPGEKKRKVYARHKAVRIQERFPGWQASKGLTLKSKLDTASLGESQKQS